MGIRKINPTSPGQRGMSKSDYSEITTDKPEKSLVKRLKKNTGRNNTGRITCRHKGGGHKRLYRTIDFKRNKIGVPAVVKTVEYDPNRNVYISLVVYADGEKRYILTPQDLHVGDSVVSGPDAEIKVGNALPLFNIPLGTVVHNIEMVPGNGAQLVRTAGGSAQLMAKEGNYVTVKMPSSEMRMIHKDCYAVVMNPVDHPHGGGEGKSPIGGKPQTPWGKPAMGYKTRKAKPSDKYIVRKRKK